MSILKLEPAPNNMVFFKKKSEKKAEESRDFKQAKAAIFTPALKRAWITEKAGDLNKLRKYIFVVQKSATKPQVKNGIETRYKVKVSSVHIINTKGKTKRRGQRARKTSGMKKAIVTLKEGNSIDVMPT